MAALSTSNQEQMFGFIYPLAVEEIRGIVSFIIIVVALIILCNQKRCRSSSLLLIVLNNAVKNSLLIVIWHDQVSNYDT